MIDTSFSLDNTLFTFLFSISSWRKMFIPLFLRGSLPFMPHSLHLSPPPICLKAFLKIFVPSRLGWRWLKGLLVVKLLFRYYFHINVIDLVGVGHSMRRWEVYLSRNFPSHTLFPLQFFPLFLGFHKILIALPILPSSGQWNSRSLFNPSGWFMKATLWAQSSSVFKRQAYEWE